ncbi:MAG: integrase core domain-containing protein [Planctomycetes bacterium]|nr:integrase core domain-containing protein [Planctomycetota bacterium]
MLREQLGNRRVRLTDSQHRRLAAKAKAIGRKLPGDFATIVTPDTLLRWHRRLIAQKWTNQAGTGRPGVMKAIEGLAVRMAKENPSWGHRRIEGALRNVGHRVAHNTVKRILKSLGIALAPERSKTVTWTQFLRAHRSTIAATDFFTTEDWTTRGLVTVYTLFVIRLETRRIHIVDSTPNLDHIFVTQAALNLAHFDGSFLADATHLILDRDAKFTNDFKSVLAEGGVDPVVLPARSPNLSAQADRFVRTIRPECLSKMIFSRQASLDRAIRQFIEHYHAERNHQGLGNELIEPQVRTNEGGVVRNERLVGLLSFYRRAA